MTKSRDIADSINRIDSSAADATAMTIDANENVGIGTGSPNGTLTIRNGNANTEQLILGNSLNTGGRDWRLGRDNVATGDFIIKYSDATNSNVTTEAMRILAGGGLTFNGDTAAANALNDYEEGTWTPTITEGTINAGSARYTKVGNMVHVICTVSSFSNRTSTNNVTIGGLPFSCASDSFAVSAILHRYVNTATGGDSVLAYQGPGTTTLIPHTCKGNANYDVVQYNNLSSTSAQLYISHTYRA